MSVSVCVCVQIVPFPSRRFIELRPICRHSTKQHGHKLARHRSERNAFGRLGLETGTTRSFSSYAWWARPSPPPSHTHTPGGFYVTCGWIARWWSVVALNNTEAAWKRHTYVWIYPSGVNRNGHTVWRRRLWNVCPAFGCVCMWVCVCRITENLTGLCCWQMGHGAVEQQSSGFAFTLCGYVCVSAL